MLKGSGNEKFLNPNEVSENWNKEVINVVENNKGKVSQKDRIKVAIIDSGIDECEGIEVKQRFNLVPAETDTLAIYDDITGHGTAIASVIAGERTKDRKSSGINKNVELYSIKVMDADNTASLSRIVEAIYIAIENDVDIINMSFGTSVNSEILHRAIKEADAAGILMIAAAGNRGKIDGKVEYPAAYEEVMSVGSIDSNVDISDTSSRGNRVDVMAPGELIKTAANFGLETVASGTSIAAPHVVGVASILWQKDKNKSADFIRGLIEQTAKVISKNGDKYEIIDLKYALKKYNEYERNYKNKNYEIKENSSEVVISEEMAKVTARWSGTNHEALVATNKNGNLTSEELKWIKAGARYNDAMLGAGKNQANDIWHAVVFQGGNKTNYMSATYFVGKIIRETECSTAKYKITSSGGTHIPGLTTAQQNHMVKDINAINIRDLIGKLGIKEGDKLTVKNKRLLLFGMSLHIITDAFAHRAYRRKPYLSGREWNDWEHIPGGSAKQADNPTIIPSRFKAAGRVIKNAMNQCLQFRNKQVLMNDTYTIRSEQVMYGNSYFDSSFLLADLYVFAEANQKDTTFKTWEGRMIQNTYDTKAAEIEKEIK